MPRTRRQQSKQKSVNTDPRFRMIPKALIISLQRTPERKIQALEEIQKLGIRMEVIPAIDGKSPESSYLPRDPNTNHLMQPGETALCASYWRAASIIVRDNLEWAIVFEDDVQIIDLTSFMGSINQLPADFHFAHLNDANSPLPEVLETLEDTVWQKVSHPSYVSVAYLISNAGARVILQGLAPFSCPVDVWFHENRQRLNIYQVKHESAWFTQSFWGQSTVRHSKSGQIPKIIHRIWLGNKPIPEDYERYWESWQKHHPDYQFKTWRDLDRCELVPDSLKNPAFQSDIIRLHILHKYGGLYVDTDFECFHSFDKLIQNSDLLVAEESPNCICNGMIASYKGHPLIKQMLDSVTERLQTMEPFYAIGPALVRSVVDGWRNQYSFQLTEGKQVIARRQGDTGVVIIDHQTLFPYYWYQIDHKLYGNAWAAHHWGRSWWTEDQWNEFYDKNPHLRPTIQLTEENQANYNPYCQ